MKIALAALIAGTLISAGAAISQSRPPAKVTLTRLDCGTVAANDLNQFSDTQAYTGQSKRLAIGCYLIRHGNDVMLWDVGLPPERQGQPLGATRPIDSTFARTVAQQLGELGIRPEQVGRIGISHYHIDHIGQADAFRSATLLIGAGDWLALSAKQPDPRIDPAPVRHWISGGGKVEPVQGDRDVFGDGSVRMIDLPGHTPGHHALLVRLPGRGNVLLSGDQAHFRENYESEGVPTFNTNRADTLASFRRFKDLAANTRATVILQHEPADIGKLPTFPKAAE